MNDEMLECKFSVCEWFTEGKIYTFTKHGTVDDEGKVCNAYLHGPHETHLENMNNCYGFVKFKKMVN